MLSLVAIFCFIKFSLGDDFVNYTNYQVLRIIPQNEHQLDLLSILQIKSDNEFPSRFDFWTSPRSLNHSVDIMIKDDYLVEMKKNLARNHIKYSTMIPDVGRLVNEERERLSKRKLYYGPNPWWRDLMTDEDKYFEDYQDIDEINNYMNDICALHPYLVSCLQIGTSYQGRPLLTISFIGPGNKLRTRGDFPLKPMMWIDCHFHAREWITTPTCLYAIKQMVKYRDTEFFKSLFQRYEITFLPLANPDGYHYSRTTNRMWRKTRSKRQNKCFGVDPNRNWGYKWNHGGSSPDPCTDSYRGPTPFSEDELRVVRDYNTRQSKIREIPLYLTFHSYSQFLLIPWSYTKSLPRNYLSMQKKALAAVNATSAVYGKEWFVGQSTRTLYVASGTSDDWHLGVLRVDNAYTWEIQDTGRFGFMMPPETILESAKEIWAGLKVLFQQVDLEQRQKKKQVSIEGALGK